MARQTELKSVSREEPKSLITTPERGLGPSIERSILSTLHDMERLFEEGFHRPFLGWNLSPVRQMFHDLGSYGEFTPTCDIFESGNEIVVKADLPGMKREDVDVKLVDNRLVITGERKSEEKVERKDYIRVERSHGSFNWTINLPEDIDSEHVKASFKEGVLEIRIAKLGDKSTVKKIKLE